MAGDALGPAFLGAAVTLGTTLYNNEKGFSSRHEQNYDSQVALTQRLVEGFAKAHREGDVDVEDHEEFVRLTDRAIETAKDYSKNIHDYKGVPTYKIPSKVKRKKQVRTSKRKLRQANEELQSHYCSSFSSCGSDASSVAAQSGSPPGSGLENERIRDWAYDVQPSRSHTSLGGEHSSEGEAFVSHTALGTHRRSSTRQRESSPEPDFADLSGDSQSASHPNETRPRHNAPHYANSVLKEAKSDCDRDLQDITQRIANFQFMQKLGEKSEGQENGDQLYQIAAIALDVSELPVARLTASVNCMLPIIQRLQDVGTIWGDHPDWPGREWFVETLLLVANLNRTVEWWKAEAQFWNSGDGELQPLKFVTRLLEDAEQKPSLDASSVLGKPTNNFVTKVYQMINDTKSGQLVSWTELGTSFVVSNVGEFTRNILGSHFKHNNFSSFVRQLNMYGFHKINRTPRAQRTSTGTQTWEFSHHKFLRGRPDLLDEIKRKTLGPDPARQSAERSPPIVAGDTGAVRNPLPPSNHLSQSLRPTSIKDFDVIKPISKSALGSVFLAKRKASGDFYAIKMITKTHMIAKNQITNLKADRTIVMKQAESPYVAKLFFVFQSIKRLYLVVEYLDGGDCATLIKSLGSLPEEWTRKYNAEIVLGVEYLHESGIVHHDLKPDNLLINSRGHIKLADFGLSRFGLLSRQVRESMFVGTPDYLAPETILGLSSDGTIDWWALGVIIYEFLSGLPPFHANTPEEIFENILSGHVEWREDFSIEATSFMKKLLVLNRHERLGYGGAKAVKAHPFSAGIDWDNVTNSEPAFIPQVTDAESDMSNLLAALCNTSITTMPILNKK